MYKRALALILIILSLILIMNFRFFITGLVLISERLGMSVSIASVVNGDIISLTAPESIVQNDFAPISAIFQNIGNQNLSETMGIYILDSDGDLVNSSIDSAYELSPLQTRTFNVNWQGTQPGNFTIIANSSYDGKTAERSRTIEVILKTIIPPVTTTPTGFGGPVFTTTVTTTTTTITIPVVSVPFVTTKPTIFTTTLKRYEIIPIEIGVPTSLIIIMITLGIIMLLLAFIFVVFNRRKRKKEEEEEEELEFKGKVEFENKFK